MDQIYRLFPNLNQQQKNQFASLNELYQFWNARINVISRKDMDSLYLHHVLHSISIALFFEFKENSSFIDIGTGGGFPGIPMAILYPNCQFHLVDSIGKKIKVVEEVANGIGLKNITWENTRSEQIKNRKFNYVLSRAVTAFPDFVKLTKHLPENGGIIYLKGGDFESEIEAFKPKIKVFHICDKIDHPFFEEKKIIFLPF